MRSNTAIIINTVTIGGRLATIVDMIAVLNELDVEPHLYALRWNVSPDKINTHYHRNLKFVGKKIWLPVRGFYDIKVALLNLWFRIFFENKYSLLINCNNCLLWLPKKIKIFTYMYFPRKARISHNRVSIHLPEKASFVRQMYRKISLFFYRYDRWSPNNTIIAISDYTRRELLRVNPEIPDCGIIYPASLEHFTLPAGKKNQVITIGRFSEIKRQFTQILIAEKIPNVAFIILGAVRDKKSRQVYESCQRYIESKSMDNVKLFANAPQQKKQTLLQESSIFLHTTINEPFGLVTIEAMASGCLPLVHDSGGSRDIVPQKQLRYSSVDEAIERILYLLNHDHEALRHEMIGRAQNFTAANFRRQMKIELSKLV